MNTYLVLLRQSKSASKNLNATERFEYYQKWGKHLSKFSETETFKQGGPLDKEQYILDTKGISISLEENNIGGYLIIEAENTAQLEEQLRDSPLLSKPDAYLQIFTINYQAMINT